MYLCSIKELWHFIEEHLTVGCKSLVDSVSDLKFTTKVLTIKSQTLSKTLSKSLFAKVVSSGFKFSSEKANTFNFAKFEKTRKSKRKMRRYSDITSMLPVPGDVENTLQFTFLENNHIASTSPRFTDQTKLENNMKSSKNILSKTFTGHTGHAYYKEQGKNDENSHTLVRMNCTKRARRKTTCGAPLNRDCADHIDCSDEADREIQEIFEQASTRRQV